MKVLLILFIAIAMISALLEKPREHIAEVLENVSLHVILLLLLSMARHTKDKRNRKRVRERV